MKDTEKSTEAIVEMEEDQAMSLTRQDHIRLGKKVAI